MKDVSRIHKKLLQLSKKTMQIKWAKDLNRHLIKKDNKHIVKGCSTALVIRET